jgi:diguanylate cyclase (GGDEF)-like protein
MRKGIRATDILGRFGGDEFMIILPTGEKEIALKIGQSIARIVEGTAVKVNPQLTLNITCSIGVATFPDDSQTPEDLFEKADQALYQIKRKGGNGAAAYGIAV